MKKPTSHKSKVQRLRTMPVAPVPSGLNDWIEENHLVRLRSKVINQIDRLDQVTIACGLVAIALNLMNLWMIRTVQKERSDLSVSGDLILTF